jgi:hypothetical protein
MLRSVVSSGAPALDAAIAKNVDKNRLSQRDGGSNIAHHEHSQRPVGTQRHRCACMYKNALAIREIWPVFIHIALAAAVGALISTFTPARWLAASFWVSAAMLINGAVATVEDARPGGFDNLDGSSKRASGGMFAVT